MARVDPVQELGRLVEEEQERIVRLWAKRLAFELNEADVSSAEVRAPLEKNVRELGRLLRDRGAEGVGLWAEGIRAHGTRRYDQRFEAADLAREFKALGQVLLRVYAKRHGTVDPVVAELVAELVGEASASVVESFTRVLRTEEVRFREAAVMETILQHVDVGILFVERDGTVSYATPAVGRLTGLPVRTLLGGRSKQSLEALLSQLDARHLDGSRFRAADMPFSRALRLGGVLHGEWMVLHHHPDGAEVVVEMSAVPLWEDGPGSGVAGAIQTMVDRTESAHKAHELTRAYEELKHLQGRLMQKTRAQALGQLAGGAAHALNNFLNVVRLRVTLLRKDFNPEHVDALERAVRNVGDLVARLQDFSAQRAEEELTEVDFDGTVTEAVELARPELDRPGRKVEIAQTLGAGARVQLDQ
ncbi:MAG: PAS domain-containing protein, partial [Myxococcaceae bacterium]